MASVRWRLFPQHAGQQQLHGYDHQSGREGQVEVEEAVEQVEGGRLRAVQIRTVGREHVVPATIIYFYTTILGG